MQCAHCNRPFEATRDDAITCSSKCRQARYRRLHRKPTPAYRREMLGLVDLIDVFRKHHDAWFAITALPLDEAAREELTTALRLTADVLLRLAEQWRGR